MVPPHDQFPWLAACQVDDEVGILSDPLDREDRTIVTLDGPAKSDFSHRPRWLKAEEHHGISTIYQLVQEFFHSIIDIIT